MKEERQYSIRSKQALFRLAKYHLAKLLALMPDKDDIYFTVYGVLYTKDDIEYSYTLDTAQVNDDSPLFGCNHCNGGVSVTLYINDVKGVDVEKQDPIELAVEEYVSPYPKCYGQWRNKVK